MGLIVNGSVVLETDWPVVVSVMVTVIVSVPPGGTSPGAVYVAVCEPEPETVNETAPVPVAENAP